MLNDYEQQLFYNLEHNIPDYRWYRIEDDREDRDKFISAIKKRIDIFNDYEFNRDYTKFRRVDTSPIPHGMTYTIEWHPNSYELNEKERNLPDPVFRNLTKKEKEHYQSRRTDI